VIKNIYLLLNFCGNIMKNLIKKIIVNILMILNKRGIYYNRRKKEINSIIKYFNINK
jgi:hypothetical protein